MLITATLLGTAFVLMLIGRPIAFAIIAASIMALTVIGNIPLMVIPQNIFTGLDRFSLLAIPFFVLAGSLMTSGGITEKLLELVNALMGRFRGGLAMSAVLSSAMFAGISGSAARTTSVIMVIVAAAKTFSWVMAYAGIPRLVADFILENISDPLVFLILVNVILLIVGMFIETNAAIVMLMPVFFPIAVSLGIDPTHFSVRMVVNLCIGLITPPAGLCLNIATVLAKTSLEDGFKGVLPFFLMALFVIAALTLFPQIVLVLV